MDNKKIVTVNPIQSTLSRDDDSFTALSTSALLAKSAVPYSHRRIADNYVIIKRVYRFQAVQSRITNADVQLLNIGNTINRLESVAEAQSIKLNNLISFRSTMRDADIAEESSNYIRYQILQQASATLLASSRNLKAQNVIGLLGSVS